MKKTNKALLILSLLSIEALYAHGTEKHMDEQDVTTMRTVVDGAKVKGMMGMNPEMREKMMQKMLGSITTIVREEMKEKMQQEMSQAMEKAMRSKIKSAMQQMQKEAQKMMQGKMRGGMQKGMQGAGQGGMHQQPKGRMPDSGKGEMMKGKGMS